ncbi:MAG: hypothetical protein IPP71_22780 [Bacteroidetes bacterium]|nr:hypothetical protein [Bacteroidota bacterium]
MDLNCILKHEQVPLRNSAVTLQYKINSLLSEFHTLGGEAENSNQTIKEIATFGSQFHINDRRIFDAKKIIRLVMNRL